MAREEAKWRSRLLKLAVWSKRLTRALAKNIFAFTVRTIQGLPAQQLEKPVQNAGMHTDSRLQFVFESFRREVEASLFCSTGEGYGPSRLAGEAAAALSHQLSASFSSAQIRGALSVRRSTLQLLSVMSQLIDDIEVRRARPPLLYVSIALVLYASLPMISW